MLHIYLNVIFSVKGNEGTHGMT